MARKKGPGGPLRVPSDARQKFDAITTLTDTFCNDRLNEEYAEMCRRLAAALARKRPSPLARGKEATWACGIVRTIGWVNYLDDRSAKPHMKLTAIDKAFGVAESTGQGKSSSIRTMLRITQSDPKWTLPSEIGDNPRVWMIQVNGFAMDARFLQREIQEQAFAMGLIPYIPAAQGDSRVQ